jgi:hypothetical protein
MKAIIKLGLGAALMLPLLPVVAPGGSAAYAEGGNVQKVIWFTSPVNLRSSGYFTILTEAGITDVPSSAIVGNVGVAPITGAADLLTCSEITGKVYSVNAAGPKPCSIDDAAPVRTAVMDMHAGYADAAGRQPEFTNLGAGNIGGLTLSPGVYKWTTGLMIPTNVTLTGGPSAVWIFQIAGTLQLASGTSVFLTGGAYARNVFWQVAGETTLGTTSHIEGTILDMTGIAIKTGASVHGRLMAQTAVTLEQNAVTGPQYKIQ